jgi:DNA-binding response OmpR family regulator
MLPGLSGEEVLPHIQNIPVIVISAKIDVDSKVDLLMSGAADYLTKPFDTKEIVARIAVQLRKAENDSKSKVLKAGGLLLDEESHEVSYNGELIKITKTEYAVLKILMANQNRTISKSGILDKISEDTPDCTEDSLKQHISNLRVKLRDVSGQDMIQAVWGIGYKLIAE